MNRNNLFTMVSLSTITLAASAATTADVNEAGQAAAANVDTIVTSPGTSSIFTLSAGPIPVTERTLEGERKLFALEEEYSRKLGWLPPKPGTAAMGHGQVASPGDGDGSGGCCSGTIRLHGTNGFNDVDDAF